MKNNLPTRIQGILLVLLATIFWSTSGILINLIYQEIDIPAVSLAFWRDLSTFITLFLGIMIFRPKLLRIRRNDLPWLLAMGAISIGLFHVLWNITVVLLGASIATVIQSNGPIFVTIMAWWVFGEALTSNKIIAVLLSVTGTILCSGIISSGGHPVTPLGIILGVIGALAYGSFTLFGKKLAGNYSPWTILFYVFAFATIALLPLQFGKPIPWPIPPKVSGYFVSLILISTITGFSLYTMGLNRLQASVASITAMAEIVFAAILAYIILNERLDFWQIFGAILVICGVILVSFPNGKIAPVSSAS
ncbi:MAG: EamA family transporter [Anaerolineales bacterium]|nr:EamA family transporter [Chloroflexota bacterium]MBL6981054.1 EamA family transporter [Anaerolineales bacterium]